tara:strand:- start:1343 stop:1450 length:108 start_codon:yes stop_codon:yes gene_type:complete
MRHDVCSENGPLGLELAAAIDGKPAKTATVDKSSV